MLNTDPDGWLVKVARLVEASVVGVPSNPEFHDMTEHEWLTCEQPHEMLKALRVPTWERLQEHYHLSPEPWVKVLPGTVLPEMCNLFRDLVGNPWRYYVRVGEELTRLRASNFQSPPNGTTNPLINDGVLPLGEWMSPDVVRTAQQVHGECDFTSLPVLADALEEAGCTEAPILEHLRGCEPCPWCRDAKFESGDMGGPFLPGLTAEQRRRGEAYHFRDCRCDGKRVRPVHHARGCWTLRLFLPSQKILEVDP